VQMTVTRRWPFYAGVFLTCLCVMALQIAETRLLSVITYYHLAFFSISMAMFGMTGGALWVYFQGDRFNADNLAPSLAKLCSAFAVSIAVWLLLLLVQVPVLALSASTAVIWGLLAVIMAIPYFFAGTVVSLALTRSPFPVGRVYAADLIGASFGCLLALLLLNLTDAPSAILGMGAIAALAAASFARAGDAPISGGRRWVNRILQHPLAIAVIFAAACFANSNTIHGLRPVVVKHQIDLRDNVQYERWNSFSRIMARRASTDEPLLWGPSDTLPRGMSVPQIRLNIDGDAATSMFRFDGDIATVSYLKYDVTNVAYSIRNSGRAAIIGVGGGRDVLSAWLFGFRDITGVELNPIFIDLLTTRQPFADFAGLAKLPGVTFDVDDARSWFARTNQRFDLIQMSMIDTFAATGAGAFSLSENGLYTVEGWKHFLGRLTPTGVFTVSRWYGSNNVNETGRMVSLAVRALLDLGVRDPSRQLYLVSVRNLATLVVARAPLSQSETDQLSRTAEQLHFRILLAPNRPSESPVLHAIVSAHDPAELETYTSSLVLDLTPPTDNRPFFFNQLPLTRAYLALDSQFYSTPGVLSGNIIASLTLLLILIVSIILVVTTIILPMRPAIRQSNRRLVLGGSAYFLLIGLGFMFIEIGLLQRLSIFLGHPTYSLSIVLFSIVLFTGIGSLLSERLRLETLGMFSVWTLLTAGYALCLPLWLPVVLQTFESGGIFVRAVVTTAIVAPVAILMGFGFPTGMGLAMRIDPRPTPWFWGINGAGGVLGSVMAVMCSITFGIATTITVGAVCYLALIPAAKLLGLSGRRISSTSVGA
jgi:hypothetical protein